MRGQRQTLKKQARLESAPGVAGLEMELSQLRPFETGRTRARMGD